MEIGMPLRRSYAASDAQRRSSDFLLTVAILSTCLAGNCVAGDGPQLCCSASPQSVRRTYRESYTNPAYGYAVRIPPGLVGQGSAPGASSHGFAIYLEPTGGSYVYVDASYNTLGYSSASDAVKDYVRQLISRQYHHLKVVSKKHSNLCELNGYEVTLEYGDVSNERTIEERIIALTSSSEQTGICYTLGLVTTDTRTMQDVYGRVRLNKATTHWFL